MSVQERALQIKQRLAAGKTVVGCFVSLGSAIAAEIMGAAGYDCAVIDLEHGSGDERLAMDQLQALAAANCIGMVRVESNQRQRVHRVLDAGAHGIMFPRIDSAGEARAAVAAMRYPSDGGMRGVASSTRACEYGANFQPYLAGSKNLLSMIQIESEAAVACVEEIAAVPGADVLFLGPWDLSFGMGIMGEFDHPRFVAAVERTAAAASAHGKVAGILLPANKSVAHYHAIGYRFILSGADAIMLQQAARGAAKSLLDQRAAVDCDVSSA
ncbi:MAG: 2-dehydro-3-deoxyglucarate aldolase [Bryobacterales bacterium]|nr:2-dehydro-3-deoxyglucarate aldolase [Bryobacterales bacterium]